MEYLANEYTVISERPRRDVPVYTPAICVLKSGRYIFTNDLGGNAHEVVDTSAFHLPSSGVARVGQIYTSDDGGRTWQLRCRRNFRHARPFELGDRIYVLGHADDLVIYCSEDGGETWDDGTYLTEGECWHQSACNVWIEGGTIALVMEKIFNRPGEVTSSWNVASKAPVVLRARTDADLTKRESWTFSNAVRFRDVVDEDALDLHGIPFYPSLKHRDEYPDGTVLTECPGWLETNIVRITDPSHYWFDPSGRTYHLFMRTHTARSGYCAVMQAVVGEDGEITVSPVIEPSGRKLIFLPMPGGQMRFHVLWDEDTRLYWLLSTQATDTMRRKELLSPERYNIPCDERDRLQLSFSKNMVDWCFAAMVAPGNSEKQSRHYASMALDGDDLVNVSRSGDENTVSAHETNLSTFHRIKNFRDLVY